MLVGMSYEPADTELNQLIDRWVAQWNEPSPDERRRLIGEVVRHAGATLALTWVMRSRADGSVAGSGLDVLTFGPGGRVRTDHQFVA
jgi:hypothetical protein